MIFDLFKISSRLEPESKFMHVFSSSLLQIRDRLEPETDHIFPLNFVRARSIVKPEKLKTN